MDLDHLRKRIQALTAPGPILDQAEAITELHQRLGSHRKAAGDLSKLQGSLQQVRVDAETLRKELRPDTTLEQIEALRLSAGQRSRIQELGAQHQALLEATAMTRRDVETLEKDLATTKKELAVLEAPREPGELRRAVSRARKQGDLEEAYQKALANLWAEEEQAQIELQRLGLWAGTLDDLEKLPIPPLETVERHESELRDLTAKKTQLEESIKERKTKISQIDLELEELRLAGAVPTEEELLKARERRDQGWKLVRRAWLNKEDITKEKIAYDANVDLSEAYEKNVTRSDEVADRLRREADRVAGYAALLAQRAECAKELDRPTEEQADTHNQTQRFQQEWVNLWQACRVTPLPPREMRSWVLQQNKLVQRAETLRELRREAGLLKERIDNHRVELDRILEGIVEEKASSDESLDAMLLRCETVVQKIEGLVRRKAELESKAAKSQSDLEVARRGMAEADTKLEQWEAHWAQAIGALGLRSHDSPVAAFAIFNKFDEFFKKFDEGNSLERRIDSINRDAKAFEVTVNALVKRIAPDLADLPFDQAAGQLNARLGKAQAESARLAELQKQVDEKERTLREAQDVIQIMSEKLDVLCRQAKCSQPTELPLIEGRFEQAEGLRNEMEVLEESLVELGGGLEIDKLIQEVAQVDADELPAHISEVSLKIDELEGKRTQLDQEIGGERTRLEQMDGNAKAAEAAEQAQGVLAEMRRGVERYVRLRLASTTLRQEIERYRAEKQEMLLRRASELFAQITLGSFSELQVGFSEKDEPVLIGLRPSGERVGVEGMSDGTRDQLYLCLRLAHIERYLEVNEPTPFIVDDILIKFDDKRAEASLKVLTDLSTKTQVIFFTHHSRLVELANAIADGGTMRVHYLNPEPAVSPTKSQKVISVARTPTQ